MWIDWNGDGDFDDANEMVIDLDDSNSAFPDHLTIVTPSTITMTQQLGVRIRLSNQDNMTPMGFITSGEVEDYLIQVNCQEACLPIQSVDAFSN